MTSKIFGGGPRINPGVLSKDKCFVVEEGAREGCRFDNKRQPWWHRVFQAFIELLFVTPPLPGFLHRFFQKESKKKAKGNNFWRLLAPPPTDQTLPRVVQSRNSVIKIYSPFDTIFFFFTSSSSSFYSREKYLFVGWWTINKKIYRFNWMDIFLVRRELTRVVSTEQQLNKWRSKTNKSMPTTE